MGVGDIIALSCVGAVIVLFILLGIKNTVKGRKRNAELMRQMEEAKDEPPELCEVAATVIGKRCEVNSRGTKTVFVGKKFYLGFRTEDGRELIFPVEEAMYLEVEEGQKGTLATVNGNYYGFYVEE